MTGEARHWQRQTYVLQCKYLTVCVFMMLFGEFLSTPFSDRSIYEYSDLTDTEILEREKRIAGERAKEIAKERKRMAKANNFHFRRGML